MEQTLRGWWFLPLGTQSRPSTTGPPIRRFRSVREDRGVPGCLPDSAHGILTGGRQGDRDDWTLEAYSSYVMHGAIRDDPQEEEHHELVRGEKLDSWRCLSCSKLF